MAHYQEGHSTKKNSKQFYVEDTSSIFNTEDYICKHLLRNREKLGGFFSSVEISFQLKIEVLV